MSFPQLFLFGFFSFFSIFSISLASDNEVKSLLRNFDLSFYHPQRQGLKDFRVDIHVDGLAKQLAERFIFGKINDIFFEISWLQNRIKDKKDYQDIKVHGLPLGFFELKSDLSKKIIQRIDFIIPVSLQRRMQEYQCSLDTNKNDDSTIICKDPENIKDANEVLIVFDSKKVLKRFIIKRPIGLETIDLKLTKQPWSQEKWVLSEYNVKRVSGTETIESKSVFSYQKIANFGLPSVMEETITQKTLIQPNSKGKNDTYEREVSSVMKFKNWRLNTGINVAEFSK